MVTAHRHEMRSTLAAIALILGLAATARRRRQ